MQARAGAPTLSSASVRAAGVAAIRLLLGVGFVAGSVARGLDGGPALLAAFAGALVLVMIALGPRGRTRESDLGDALPVPPDARFDPRWLGVLQACVPSTVGVAAMAGRRGRLLAGAGGGAGRRPARPRRARGRRMGPARGS